MKILASIILLSLVALNSNASIVPENKTLEVPRFNSTGIVSDGITKEEFDRIADELIDSWRSDAKTHGATLVLEKLWESSVRNAYAYRDDNEWKVSIHGAFARLPEMTPDAYALVLCHELGHHFGGYPFKSDKYWAASEGQSDYWAAQVCARRIWANRHEENKRVATEAEKYRVNYCDLVYHSPEEQNLCKRIAIAGIALARVFEVNFGSGRPTPSIDTYDPRKVPSTQTSHPDAQCRLDTYLHGILCTQVTDPNVIPGLRSDATGVNTPSTEIEAARYSCMEAGNYKIGDRPRCWFKALNNPFRIDEDFSPSAVSTFYTGVLPTHKYGTPNSTSTY